MKYLKIEGFLEAKRENMEAVHEFMFRHVNANNSYMHVETVERDKIQRVRDYIAEEAVTIGEYVLLEEPKKSVFGNKVTVHAMRTLDIVEKEGKLMYATVYELEYPSMKEIGKRDGLIYKGIGWVGYIK